MKHTLFFAAICLALASADQHIFTYVGYDHLLDFDPISGNIRAFDFRRQLPAEDQCDAFVNPPLIEKSNFIDVMTSSMSADQVFLTYLGWEHFMVQDSVSGTYTVRRCSGFMPQQTRIPCEVWSVGHDPAFTAPNRYFFGGAGRVIRYNRLTQAFDLLNYDPDVHGGGFPFGRSPLVSAQFSAFPEGANVTFAYIELANPSMSLLAALDEDQGQFKVWRYNKDVRDNIAEVVGQLLMTGTLLPHFEIKTMGEDMAIAYDKTSGDFEIWKFAMTDGKLGISVIKRDNIENGHGCIFDTRQDCIAHPTCGWCGDSLTCHQLSSVRVPCDGSSCLNLVDQYSPEHKKFQNYELPIPSELREFGEKPADNPMSPLRKLSYESATPLLRSSDLQNEQIMDGYQTNPSEGIVYVPPKASAPPCMDDEWVDPRDLPPPNIRKQEGVMNAADGAVVPTANDSPIGDAAHQYEPPCVDPVPLTVVKNVTKKSFPAMNSSVPVPQTRNDFVAPEIDSLPADDAVLYIPTNDGTAMEEDLMNGIISHYSSLMPKGNDVATLRPEADDPPAPPTNTEIRETTFKPREGGIRDLPHRGPAEALLPEAPAMYSPGQMEMGVIPSELHSDCAESHEYADHMQKNAMENSQYRSSSILNPAFIPSTLVTKENQHDRTGQEIVSERQLDGRPDEEIVEGWDVKTVKVEDAQTIFGSDPTAVVAPKPEVDLGVLNEKYNEKEAAKLEAKNKAIEELAKKQGIELSHDDANTPDALKEAHEEFIKDIVQQHEEVTGDVVPTDSSGVPILDAVTEPVLEGVPPTAP